MELAEFDVLGDAELVSELLGEADWELLGDVVKSLGLTAAEVLEEADGVQVAGSLVLVCFVALADLVALAFAELVLVSGTEVGIGVSRPVGNAAVGSGAAVLGDHVNDAVDWAGQVLASSTDWICGWPGTVSTVAEAAVSCSPGKVAT